MKRLMITVAAVAAMSAFGEAPAAKPNGGARRPAEPADNICALIAMAMGVYLFDVRFGMNYMYLVHISPASPLEIFAELGDYRIGYAVVLAALVLVMYGLPALLRRGRR